MALPRICAWRGRNADRDCLSPVCRSSNALVVSRRPATSTRGHDLAYKRVHWETCTHPGQPASFRGWPDIGCFAGLPTTYGGASAIADYSGAKGEQRLHAVLVGSSSTAGKRNAGRGADAQIGGGSYRAIQAAQPELNDHQFNNVKKHFMKITRTPIWKN